MVSRSRQVRDATHQPASAAPQLPHHRATQDPASREIRQTRAQGGRRPTQQEPLEVIEFLELVILVQNSITKSSK